MTKLIDNPARWTAIAGIVLALVSGIASALGVKLPESSESYRLFVVDGGEIEEVLLDGRQQTVSLGTEGSAILWKDGSPILTIRSTQPIEGGSIFDRVQVSDDVEPPPTPPKPRRE